MLDGIAILVKKGNGEAIKPIMRTLLEMKFNIEYILKADEKSGVLAYQLGHARKKINDWKRIDPTTDQGKDLLEKVKEFNLDFSGLDHKKMIKELEEMLLKDPFKEVDEEWLRTKRNIKRNPDWHALYDGPRKINDLAKHLDQEAYYAVIYKNISSSTHGSATLGRVQKDSTGNGINPGIRRIEGIPNNVTPSLSFAFQLFRILLGKFNPEIRQHFSQFYMEEIRGDFLLISNLKFKVNYST